MFQHFISIAVPRYHLVDPIIKRNTRAAHVEVQLKAFGDDIKLYLNPTEGILAGYDTPVWEVEKGYPKPKITKVKNVRQFFFFFSFCIMLKIYFLLFKCNLDISVVNLNIHLCKISLQAILNLQARLLEDAKKGATVVATEMPDKTTNIVSITIVSLIIQILIFTC